MARARTSGSAGNALDSGRIFHESAGWTQASRRLFHYGWMEKGDSIEPDVEPVAVHDVLLAMDVLEHIQDDVAALSKWLTYLASGGYVLITVPAFRWLWSYHDERLGHVRRYTRSTVSGLAAECGLEQVRTRYAFGYMVPAVTLIRKLVRPPRDSTDLRPHSALINQLLKRAGQIEARLRWNHFIGTSVVGIFRKR